MRKLFLILMTLMACSWSLSAQTRTIHGTVLDAANGEPLIGATVMPIGGGQGAAADIDGNFTLNVPANVKKAKVSYVGYTTQTVDLANNMVVKLASSATSLDDVVVVAYGTSTKESLTGSVAVVGTKEIEDRPVTSVTAALEGNAPGVQVNNSVGQPGSSPTIRIRGFNSINGSNAPLYVVDGIPYEGAIADLNPADIESMSVLKDAASCALYGNRGANGVILITTKKAKNSGSVEVVAQIRQGMYNRGLPFYERLSPNDWMTTTLRAYANGLMTIDSETYPDYAAGLAGARRDFFSTVSPGCNIYGVPDAEVFNEDGSLAVAGPLPGYDDLDWWKYVSRSGYRQEYNLNMASASDKYNVFASVAYLKENGYMLRTDFERFNARVNANFQPVKYLKVGVNLLATQQESETGSADSTELDAVTNPFLTMFTAPVYPVYAHNPETGEILRDESGAPIWNTAQYLQANNIAWSMRLDRSNYSATVLDGTLYGTAVIPYGFEVTVRGSMHRDKTNSMEFQNREVGSAQGVGGLQTSYSYWGSHTFMQQLTWNQDYGLNHVDVLLDHENYSMFSEGDWVSKNEMLFDGIYNLSNFDNLISASGSKSELRTESYLGRARYNYDNRYFAEASIRRDGTSRFHKDNRWGTFWSAGASWIISREKFMDNVDWLNNLKLRAAYGSVGNDATASAYAYLSLYRMWRTIDGKNTLIPAQLAANNVRWEATKTFDCAVDGSMFDGRFNFTVGYFNKRNSDLLFNVVQAASVGMNSDSGSQATVLTNVGTMQNIGWELQFGYDILRKKDLLLSFNIDATFMKNKIIKLPNNRDMPSSALFMGKSIYEKYGVTWAGVDQLTGQSLYEMAPDSPDYWIYDDKGNIDPAKTKTNYEENYLKPAQEEGCLIEMNGKLYTYNPFYAGRKVQGTALPTVYGSFGPMLSWKGFNLSLLFTYSLGGKITDSNYASLMTNGNGKASALHKDILKSWTHAPEGMTADSPNRIDPDGVPQLNTANSEYNNYSSSRWYTSASYLTLKNLNASYDFPRKWTDAMMLRGLNLGFSVDNLFIITSRKGLNPQYSFGGGQGAFYVPARVFQFQLTAKF